MSIIDTFCRNFAEARVQQEFGIPAHRPWPVGKETMPRLPPTAEEIESCHREIDEQEDPERWSGLE